MKSTDIEHVFFDIGGVLGTNGWDTGERRKAVEHFHLDAADFESRHQEAVDPWESGDISMDEYLDMTVFFSPRSFSKDEFRKFMFDQSVPNDESIAVARELRALGRFEMMTLNNEAEELNCHRIELFGLAPLFDAFFSSCWMGMRKPRARIYRDALAIAQAVPARSLFIDDREPNLAPARAAGMNVLLFTSAQQLRSELGGALGVALNKSGV